MWPVISDKALDGGKQTSPDLSPQARLLDLFTESLHSGQRVGKCCLCNYLVGTSNDCYDDDYSMMM